MVFKFQYGILISSLILTFLLGATGVSHAVLSMNEVQYLFAQEKGQSWKDATSQEKKAFIRDVRGREEYQEGQFKEKKKKRGSFQGDETSTALEKRKKKAPYKVRTSFKNKTGTKWDDATEEEQKIFWQEYKNEEKRLKQEEKLYRQEQKRLEQQRKAEFKQKKQEMKRKKQLKDQEEKAKRAEIKRKRAEERRRAETKKREWEAFRQEMKDKHERSKQR